MQVFTVSLFGHRSLTHAGAVERILEEIVCEILVSKDYIEFLVGRDGEFDLLAASVIKRCKRVVRADNSALVWVLPYMTADFRKNRGAYLDYYDDVEVLAAGTHFKGAMQTRNREMVDRSDLVVFFVERKSGGAYQTLRYAEKHGVPYINISGGVLNLTVKNHCFFYKM